MRPGPGRTPGTTGRLPLLVLPVVLLLLASCGSDDDDDDAGPGAVSPPVAAQSEETGSPGSAEPEEAEAPAGVDAGVGAAEFVDLLAAHLCGVQGTVYDDPAQMGEAFGSLPEVPGLSVAETEELAAEVRADPDLSGSLNEALQDSCGDA